MVALSKEFKSNGHQVHLIALLGNTNFITKNGIETSSCGEDWDAVLGAGMGKDEGKVKAPHNMLWMGCR